MKHHQSYDVWIQATRSVDSTDTIYFQHAYITKPKVTKTDIVADVATKLIEAIKGNYAAMQNKTDIEALNQLSQVFVDATKILCSIEIGTQPAEQAPRVEENAATPRVEQTTPVTPISPTEPPPMVHKATNIPNLIPADNSDNESSNNKSSKDDEDDE
ncbi:hypothetical protein ACHAW6_008506 [Cyclotella cf. meneghiniana]